MKRSLTTWLTLVLALCAVPAVASANLYSATESTDEAGNVWQLRQTGDVLAGAEVREYTKGVEATHWRASFLASGIGVYAGHVYLSEFLRVSELTTSGAPIRQFGQGDDIHGAIAIGPTNQDVFVASSAGDQAGEDEANPNLPHHVSVFTPEGVAIGGFGSATGWRPTWEIGNIVGLAVSASGVVSVNEGSWYPESMHIPPTITEWTNEWQKV
jgi:hypothetical protein